MSYWIGVVAGLLAAFSWAFAAVLYRKALTTSGNPLVMNILRVPLALLILIIIVASANEFEELILAVLNLNILGLVILAVLLANVIGDTFYLLAIRNVGVSTAYPLCFSYPIFVGLLALIFLHEKFKFLLFLGTMIALLGVWFISRNKENNSCMMHDPALNISGILFAFAASLCWSFAIVMLRVAVVNVSAIVIGTLKLIILVLFISPFFVVNLEDVKKSISWKVLTIMVIGGAIGIGIGDLLFYFSLYFLGAGLAAALTVTGPLQSLILASLLLKEKITREKVLGTVLIIFGVLLILL